MPRVLPSEVRVVHHISNHAPVAVRLELQGEAREVRVAEKAEVLAYLKGPPHYIHQIQLTHEPQVLAAPLDFVESQSKGHRHLARLPLQHLQAVLDQRVQPGYSPRATYDQFCTIS